MTADQELRTYKFVFGFLLGFFGVWIFTLTARAIRDQEARDAIQRAELSRRLFLAESELKKLRDEKRDPA